MNESETKNKNLLKKNYDHKSKMKQLGDVKLSQDVFCDLDAEKKEQNHEKTKATVFGFLHAICGAVPSKTRAVKYVKAVQNFTDEDIRNILVFVANLEDNNIGPFFYTSTDDKIRSTLPSKLSNLDKNKSLQIKKAYVIWVLISFGVSPTKIKECLENEDNKNKNLFKDLNWENICKQAINLRKNIESVDYDSDNCYFAGNGIWISLLFLNYIYVLEHPVNDNKDFNHEDLGLSRDNLYHQYYGYMGTFSSGSGFQNFAASLSILFILRYLELKNKNQEIKNLFGKNGVFANAFRKINSTQNTDHDKDVKILSEKYKDDFALYLKSRWFKRYTFQNFYDAMFPDFYQIIDNLPQECIFIFMCEMMRGVTLTNAQLAYVKQKIQNRDLSSYLEKINYDPEYKLNDTVIIENDTKIYRINYLCEKLFCGIGYLLAMTFILAIHTAIAAILTLIVNYLFPYLLSDALANPVSIATILIAIINPWFLYLIYAILASCALYFVISGIKNDSKPFEKCVDFMKWAYGKTVGYLMKIWALHHPTNKIPKPPIINNYPPNQTSITGNISLSEGRFNPSMEKDNINGNIDDKKMKNEIQ